MIGNLTLQWEWVMIQFVRDNIEQATELMLFNSTEILLKLELYLKNIFQIRSNTLFKYKYKYKYANLVFFKYKYKYLRIWIQIQIRIRIWTQPWKQPWRIWINASHEHEKSTIYEVHKTTRYYKPYAHFIGYATYMISTQATRISCKNK